jgi:hypothetical protein
MRLGRQHPITGDQVTGLGPAGRSADEVVGRGRELRLAVAAGLFDGELQEPLGGPLLNQLTTLRGTIWSRRRVVGHHLDVHLLVDDLADLLGSAVGQLHPGAVGKAAEHHADLLAQLVDEDRGGARIVQRAGDLPQRLAHQAGLQADVAVAHLALDLRARHQRGHRVDDQDVQRAERISMSAISSACSPVSGWDTSSASVSTPSFWA